jgi:Holliday junction resolvase
MKKIPRDPTRFDAIDWFGEFCKSKGYSIGQTEALDAFLNNIRDNIKAVIADDNRLRGIQGQAMFEALVIELGHATFTRQEDSGRLYSTSAVQPLDLRVTLSDNRTLLIEIKDSTATPWLGECVLIPKKQFHRYREYAKTVGGDPMFAIFWRKLWRWVLVPPKAFVKIKKSYALTLEESFKLNEMSVLGDRMLATRTPLRMKVETDPNQPRELDSNGFGHYTIKSIELFCRDKPIKDEAGKKLAFYMMLFGRWRDRQPSLHLDGRTILAVDWIFEPEADEADPDCYIVDALSSMFSRQFEFHTRDRENNLRILSTEAESGRLATLAPQNFPFKTSDLPLWVFRLEPSDS